MNNPSINRNNQVNLTTWLKDIEKINKEEETIPANFENVSEYFTNLLNEILSGRGSYLTSYHKKLFKDFCSYLQNDNIVIKRCKPSIVNNITNFNPKFDLRNAKKTGKLKSVTSDLRKLRSQFIAINEIYNSKCFVSQISKSIIKDPSDSYYQRYFIEYLRSRYQTRDVMKIVKGNIAKIFFEHFKFKIHSKIINDEYILQNADQATASLKKNFQTFMKNTLEQENFEDCLKTVFQQDQSWKYIENKLVQDSKRYFKIFNDLEFEKIENLQDLGFRENQVRDLKLLIKNFVVRILSHLIFSTISNLYTNSYSETILSLIKNEYFTRFSQLVIDAINDKDNHHRPTFLIGECFISEFASITSEEEARKIYSDIIENELILFTLAIVKFIRKKSKSELDLYTKLENSLEYKLIILEYLDNLTVTVIKRLAKFYEKDRKDLDQRKFVSNLISRVTRSLSAGQEIQYIPSKIEVKFWSKLITRLINESMKLKLRPWQVIFIIGNLDCDSKIIDLGKVKFYDPRKWDFGESDFIDTSKGFKINTNEEFGSNFKSFSVNYQENRIIRNSARAVMYVRAAEESSALQIARAMLLRSINFLVLEFSEKYYRFKPQTPFYYHITDIQRKHTPAGLNRAELFGIYKIDKNDEERLKVVNRFLSRTSLKDQISLSTEWYHKGLWDLSEYGKFVSYWIALERLVFEYSKLRNSSIEKVLLHYIPKIIVTWRKSSIWYAVSNHLRSILFSIRKSRSLRLKLNKDSTLSEWKKGYVLLENLEYFETLTSDRNLLTQINLLKEIVTKNNLKKLKKELASMREIEKFRIAYLHSVRNAVFHEGTIYSEHKLSQCNVILKNILDNMIGVLISENLTSFKKIIWQLNRPYLL